MHPNLPDPMNLVQELKHKGIVEPDCEVSERLRGTTLGTVYVLKAAGQPAYVLKLDDPQQIYITARFLTGYSGNPLLPRLLYADPHNEFIVYSYIRGSAFPARGPKKGWLPAVAERLIGAYVVAEDHHGWGWMDEPADSWLDFIQERIQEARAAIGDLLPEEEHAMVQQLALPHAAAVLETAGTGIGPAYWLHGDCGVHNFLFEQGELTGVIDPSPMIGPPLYDLVFAFCSSPDDLSPDTLLDAADAMPAGDSGPLPRSLLIRETVIQLYYRIATCLRHHPDDLPAYLEAWAEWKNARF